MVVIRRKGAAHDRAGGGEVDRELVRDGRVLDIGDAFRREQRREDVAILAGFAGGERGERPDRKAEIEADAIQVTGTDSGAGQNEQTMLGQQLAELVHERKDRLRTSIHDGAAADLHDLHPGQEPDGPPARNGTGEVAVEQGLARERRGDVLDGVGGFGHVVGLTSR